MYSTTAAPTAQSPTCKPKTYICQYCRKEFKPKRWNRTTYCCREHAYAYRREHKQDEHKPAGKPCLICGEPCQKKRWVYCSDGCRKESARRKSYDRSKRETDKPDRECKQCHHMFKPEYGDKSKDLCSDACKKLQAKANRRAYRKARRGTTNFNGSARKRLRSMFGDQWREHYEPIDRRKVFERDGWHCRICGCEVQHTKQWQPQQATVDHIIPLALGGDHKYENVQCACMACNSIKSDTMPEIEVVGLESLRLALRVELLRGTA